MSGLPTIRFFTFDAFVTELKHDGQVECRAEVVRNITPESDNPENVVVTADFTLVVSGLIGSSRILKFVSPFAKVPGIKNPEDLEKAETEVAAKFEAYKAELIKAEALVFKPGIYE